MTSISSSTPPPVSSAATPAENLYTHITPPGSACRILPQYSPPDYHFYDSYSNCFQHRPEVRKKLREAARRHVARRLADLSAPHASGVPFLVNVTDGASSAYDGVSGPLHIPSLLRSSPTRRTVTCHCALNATQLFATPHDVPQPPLPLSKCELHEVLLSLPPRWQNFPWKLCFDTAQDGFSLSSLYRAMAAIEEQQAHAKTVAFGLFFVHTREDVLMPTAGKTCTPTSASAKDSVMDRSPSTSLQSSPTARGSEYATSFSHAHRASSRRYGPSRSAVPHNVIGCFTPEVPCLTHHPANVYFGSAESFVFRLDQLSMSAEQGQWMQQAFEDATAEAVAEQQQTRQNEENTRLSVNGKGDDAHPDDLLSNLWSAKNDVGQLSSGVFTHCKSKNNNSNTSGTYAMAGGGPSPAYSTHGVAARSVGGFAQMSDSADQTHVPVPMPTHMTIEALLSSTPASSSSNNNTPAKGNTPALSPSSFHRSTVTPSKVVSKGAAAEDENVQGAASKDKTALPRRVCATSPSSSVATTPSQRAPTRSWRSVNASSSSPLRDTAPRAPLLSKYGWAGCPDNRKFLVCNPHFFALGAGKSGAALYVDEALQFGTSSRWCETFNAPYLFGPDVSGGSPAESAASTPSKGQPSFGKGLDTTANATSPHLSADGVGTPTSSVSASLPHGEFAISRVVWFSITEDKRTFRLMNGAGADAVMEGSAEARRCRCGRVCRTADGEGLDIGEVSSPVGLSYMHHCDLLPFTEQPY